MLLYACRLNKKIPNGKLVKKYFHVVKVTQYVVYEEDRTSIVKTAGMKFGY